MTTLPRITVMCFTDVRRDGRVLRQVRRLARFSEVTLIHCGPAGESLAANVTERILPRKPGVIERNLRAVPLYAAGRLIPEIAYERWYWGRRDYAGSYPLAAASKPDLILVDDWQPLPAAARASQETGAPIVLDLHEYYPAQRSDSLPWRLLMAPLAEYMLRRYASRAAATITVCEAIADRYLAEFGFRPAVVMNIPTTSLKPDFRAVDPDRIKLSHHGLATPGRKLEVLIDTMALVRPEMSLQFRLVGDQRYITRLKQRAAANKASARIRFEPPVPPDDIVSAIARCDIGVNLLPALTYNHAMALPNKFFECVHAGLAILIGPSPEMKRLTNAHGFGVTASRFSAVDAAETLENLTADDIDNMKRAAIAARLNLDPEKELDKLETVVRGAL